MNKEEKQVEDSIYYARRVIQANSNILWTYQFIGNIPDSDKQNPARSHQHWQGGKFYQQCNYWDRDRRRTWWISGGSSKKVSREQFVCEAREMQVEG